jgi:hypothetical protein
VPFQDRPLRRGGPLLQLAGGADHAALQLLELGPWQLLRPEQLARLGARIAGRFTAGRQQ